MSEEKLRQELIGSFKNRAMLYLHFFRAMSGEVGEERATAIMKRAIYQRGTEVSRTFAHLQPTDMEGIRDAFLAFIPDGGALFGPELLHCGADGVDIKFHRCPLKEAWLEEGVPEAEVAKLCAIAGQVDDGTFQAAGFGFHADTWQPGRDGCCHLHIRPGGA